MNVYSVEVRVWAMAYIRAESEDAAREIIAARLSRESIDVTTGEGVPISGARFDDPDMPELSLSPAMTIDGPSDNTFQEVDQ